MGPPVWPTGLARSLCKPSRGGTCHVPRASYTPEKYKITRPPVGSIHPENLVRMLCTVFTPDSRNLDRQTEGREGGREGGPTTENANLSPQYKSPEYKEPSYAKAYEFSFVYLRFWTRCPPAVRSWRRAKIVGNLCEVYHFALLSLVHFPEIRGFAACTCTMYQQHSKSCTI